MQSGWLGLVLYHISDIFYRCYICHYVGRDFVSWHQTLVSEDGYTAAKKLQPGCYSWCNEYHLRTQPVSTEQYFSYNGNHSPSFLYMCCLMPATMELLCKNILILFPWFPFPHWLLYFPALNLLLQREGHFKLCCGTFSHMPVVWYLPNHLQFLLC